MDKEVFGGSRGDQETVLYQDNMSSMLLEQNGQQSSTKRTRHMDIRYFYVGDHIQNKTLSLQHCPTNAMLAVCFTKPLQGSLFIRLCNHIMGAEFEDGNPKTHRSVLEYQDDHENKEASERDQEASKWDQNDENVCGVSTAWDQNSKNVCGASMHQEEDAIKKEKQMTYRKALLGLDNSELGSDF